MTDNHTIPPFDPNNDRDLLVLKQTKDLTPIRVQYGSVFFSSVYGACIGLIAQDGTPFRFSLSQYTATDLADQFRELLRGYSPTKEEQPRDE